MRRCARWKKEPELNGVKFLKIPQRKEQRMQEIDLHALQEHVYSTYLSPQTRKLTLSIYFKFT